MTDTIQIYDEQWFICSLLDYSDVDLFLGYLTIWYKVHHLLSFDVNMKMIMKVELR
jgi:hypothetical protein